MKALIEALRQLGAAFARTVRLSWTGLKALEPQRKDEFSRYLLSINTRRALVVLVCLILIEISNLILDFVTKAHAYWVFYMAAGIFLLLVCFLYLPPLLRLFTGVRPFRHPRLLLQSFWLCLTVGCAAFAALDLLERGSLNNTVFYFALISTFPLFTLGESLFFSLTALILICTSPVLFGMEAFFVHNAIIIALVGVLLSQQFFSAALSTFQDKADLREANKKLRLANNRLAELSRTDDLTGLLNRRSLEDQLRRLWAHALERGAPLHAIMLDIDLFKPYNDTYGHLAGDNCLSQVARCIQGVPAPAPALFFRYGGEEFLILLDGPKGDAGLSVFAEALRRSVADLGLPSAGGTVAPTVTISLGVATVIPEPGMDCQTLISLADKALYRAKAEGRNRVVFGGEGGGPF